MQKNGRREYYFGENMMLFINEKKVGKKIGKRNLVYKQE